MKSSDQWLKNLAQKYFTPRDLPSKEMVAFLLDSA